MSDNEITARLEYLRGEIRAERISYGELAELQGLALHIEPGDTELLEWAGVPENGRNPIMPLTLENKNQPDTTHHLGPVMLTPDIDEDYWLYRVRVSGTQAIVGFPKF